MEETKANGIQIGDTILIKNGTNKGSKGKVIVVRDSSVIVELGKNPNTGEPIRTVINHKNYKTV
ncbi:ribosomal protein L24 [Bacillus tianshenii]|uniref:Ribosomal protein L24 n=1 Tax=Sutcliffiella tianshenii TaxID=1463404 RepID=A0ABS2NXD2_9BACI|nr:DUF2187 family protein [Bacillus tianshenii]MBM7619297.1 ribosomal protein L24 [Bacillus tianshenii]MCA1319532.1 YkvS family protein [Bacillus tianshenii]